MLLVVVFCYPPPPLPTIAVRSNASVYVNIEMINVLYRTVYIYLSGMCTNSGFLFDSDKK